jgi:hypothetical protein
VGLLSKWQKLNWSGITPQKAEITPQNAKIKLEWDYSPKGKNLTGVGLLPQKTKFKSVKILPFGVYFTPV